MDLGILVGIALIVIWAIGALVFDGPGWIHLLLDRRRLRRHLANRRAWRSPSSRTQVTALDMRIDAQRSSRNDDERDDAPREREQRHRQPAL